MHKLIRLLTPAIALVLIFPAPATAFSAPVIFYYGDISLSGGFQASHAPQIWDLTACDLTLSAEVDMTGLLDEDGAHAWAEFGVRTTGYGDFNPTWQVEGAGVWLATDYDGTINTFDPDPVGAPGLDLDDKLILQKAGGQGEGNYNLPAPAPAPWNNHRIWYDRDGVDPWQAMSPLAVDGGTYNTEGTYDIHMVLHATDLSNGTAYLQVNGLDQGFETDGNWQTMELTPAGMTFSGDMTQMQVFFGIYGSGGVHTVVLRNVTVGGCLVLEQGMATGGGWFVAEDGDHFTGETPGGKASFGFMAKQKDGKSSGQLEFQYHADGLTLKSTSYDWVTVAGSQVLFEGTGALNDVEGFRFRVRAVDGDLLGTGVDRFEIRIWTSGGAFDSPLYRMEGDLAGGQIVVHKK